MHIISGFGSLSEKGKQGLTYNRHFKIRGLDVPLGGVPSRVIEDAQPVGTVAALGEDYVGLEPKMLVREGDKVSIGQPLFEQKRDSKIKFVSPASGIVDRIDRGRRRKLQSVVIRRTSQLEDPALPKRRVSTDYSEEEIRLHLQEQGLWTSFRTRPFSKIPNSDSKPRSIFVTACDTRPLAGEPLDVVLEHPDAFELGVDLLARLTSGSVYLCTNENWTGPTGTAPSVVHAFFGGPHPAGLPGTHIHHLDPVGIQPDVWHINYQDVIAIGKLIGEGIHWTQRIIALGGTAFNNPRIVRTRLGAHIPDLVHGEICDEFLRDGEARLISGCVLAGRKAHGPVAFLGRYHLQVSAISECSLDETQYRQSSSKRYSFSNIFSRITARRSNPTFTTDQNGRAAAMIPIDAFERLLPLDMLAAPLLKSLLIQDTDQAQALGCLELDEEDLALCSFVCQGKNDYAAVLRRNLDIIDRDE